MTMKERIAAAARYMFADYHGPLERVPEERRRKMLVEAKRLLQASFPELFDGSGWIAPVEMTAPMYAAARGWEYPDDAWAAARDAHLKPNAPTGETK